jgi:hypothetical protein
MRIVKNELTMKINMKIQKSRRNIEGIKRMTQNTLIKWIQDEVKNNIKRF